MISARLKVLLFSGFLAIPAQAWAQSVDAGRGDVAVTLPADYSDSSAYPLVLLLHAYGIDANTAEEIWGFTGLVDEYDYIYAAPSGTFDQSGSPFWNATAACCNLDGSSVDDGSYLYNLVQSIKATYNIDANRVYVVGDSNGGFMALELAYRFPDLIAASVSSAGASHAETRPDPRSGVHILQIQGTDDSSILYGGGSLNGAPYPGSEATILQWAGYNGCASPGRAGEPRDLDATIAGSETEVLIFDQGCRQDGSAELWTIRQGGHGLGRPVPTSSLTQLLDWLFTRARSGWPSPFSGVIPPAELQLGLNNIGSYNFNDSTIYSCLKVLDNGEESAIDGISRFDTGFVIASAAEGTIRLVKARPFNANNELNRNLELPDCSGSFELTTGVYSDTVKVGTAVYQVSFQLRDEQTLELELLSLALLSES